ncbi:MAG: Flp family type IVb pilin [Tepidisphaeraceae bacterium]|jgi:Flp pilus assembly pilin Flp
MRVTTKWSFGRAWKDERGGEVVEYAVVAGLVIVAAIAVVSTVGSKVLARWTSLDSSLQSPSSSTPGPSATGGRNAPPPVSPAQ